MLERRIGQETVFGASEKHTSLAELIDWAPIERRLKVRKLADMLDDRASFRRFCGVAHTEPTPKRAAFVRFHGLLERSMAARRMPGVRFMPGFEPTRHWWRT